MFLGLPQRAGLFWLVVVTTAAIVLVANWEIGLQDLSLVPAALLFALTCGVAERIQVRLNSSRPGSEVLSSVSCAVHVAVVLLFPLPWAAVRPG